MRLILCLSLQEDVLNIIGGRFSKRLLVFKCCPLYFTIQLASNGHYTGGVSISDRLHYKIRLWCI